MNKIKCVINPSFNNDGDSIFEVLRITQAGDTLEKSGGVGHPVVLYNTTLIDSFDSIIEALSFIKGVENGKDCISRFRHPTFTGSIGPDGTCFSLSDEFTHFKPTSEKIFDIFKKID